MGTRAYVGMEINGKIIVQYSHWDGAPDNLGRSLLKSDREKIKTVLQFGEIRNHSDWDSLDNFQDRYKQNPMECTYMEFNDLIKGEIKYGYVYCNGIWMYIDPKARPPHKNRQMLEPVIAKIDNVRKGVQKQIKHAINMIKTTDCEMHPIGYIDLIYIPPEYWDWVDFHQPEKISIEGSHDMPAETHGIQPRELVKNGNTFRIIVSKHGRPQSQHLYQF